MFFSRVRPEQRVLFAVLFLVVIVAGTAIRVKALDVPDRRTEDEGIYTFYARNVAMSGPGCTRMLVDGFNRRREMWSFPPPIRIGYIYLAGLVMKVTGVMDMSALSGMSCAFSVLTMILLAVAGLRFLNPWIAFGAVTFLAVSPMELAIARRAWQDGVLGFFGLALMYLCCEISLRPKKWVLYAPFWVVGGYCLLIKESALAIYGLCVLWLLFVLMFREKDIVRALKVGAVSLIVAGVSYAILFYAVGGAGKVVETLRHTAASLSRNAYVLKAQRGPWYYAWEAFGILTPITTLFAFTGTVMAVASARFAGIFDRDRDGEITVIHAMAYFLIALTVMSAIPEYLKNIRFISVIFYPFYMISALGLWRTACFASEKIKKISARGAAAAAAAVVCLVVLLDYGNFHFIFVKHRVKDPVNPILRNINQYKFVKQFLYDAQ